MKFNVDDSSLIRFCKFQRNLQSCLIPFSEVRKYISFTPITTTAFGPSPDPPTECSSCEAHQDFKAPQHHELFEVSLFCQVFLHFPLSHQNSLSQSSTFSYSCHDSIDYSLMQTFLLLHLSISPGSKKSHFAAQATQFNTDNFLLFKGEVQIKIYS